jgi:hypothetical protein
MTDIKNLYFKIDSEYPPEELKKRIVKAYDENEKIRMIFDLDDVTVKMDAMKKVKRIFEEVGVEKLVETCICSKEKFKMMLVKQFLRLVKTERPVRFL